MVILVSTLIIINSSVNSIAYGYGAFYVICPRASNQTVTPLDTSHFLIQVRSLLQNAVSAINLGCSTASLSASSSHYEAYLFPPPFSYLDYFTLLYFIFTLLCCRLTLGLWPSRLYVSHEMEEIHTSEPASKIFVRQKCIIKKMSQ